MALVLAATLATTAANAGPLTEPNVGPAPAQSPSAGSAPSTRAARIREQKLLNVSLTTHNGGIECTQLSGDAQLKTHNGNVHVSCSQEASSACEVSVVTYNGSIEFAAPPGFAGRVEAATHNGSVHTDLPVTVMGEVSKSRIEGTIGTAQGSSPRDKLHLETHNGSIRIR